jgi:three-Cys-motif partner protein
MAKKPKYELDSDELPIEEVGPWAKKKLKILHDYIIASGAARRKFKDGFSSYIDVFCGPGKAKIRTTGEIIDGSPLVAVKSSASSLSPFSSIHISDADYSLLEAATERLRKHHSKVVPQVGPAKSAVKAIASKIDPKGLHLAFVDPYNIGNLSFTLFEEFARFQSIDILVHVSVSDLRRNADRYSREDAEQFDSFAPDWREHIDEQRHNARSLRTEILKYWAAKVETLGLPRAHYHESVKAPGGQELYWLVLLSGHPLAHDLFKKIGSTLDFNEVFD